MADHFSAPERHWLLQLARQAVVAAVNGEQPPNVDETALSAVARDPGACFVTLTKHGDLRGCIGGLVAEVPLYQEVQRRAAQAALNDYRFGPVHPAELPHIKIELSILTPPRPLAYDSPADLPRRLRPHLDGVTLYHRFQRATFLPQVWEKVPDPEQFLSMLCEKMGAPANLWRHTQLEVEVYGVEMFEEESEP